jgi:hypothetical protein
MIRTLKYRGGSTLGYRAHAQSSEPAPLPPLPAAGNRAILARDKLDYHVQKGTHK